MDSGCKTFIVLPTGSRRYSRLETCGTWAPPAALRTADFQSAVSRVSNLLPLRLTRLTVALHLRCVCPLPCGPVRVTNRRGSVFCVQQMKIVTSFAIVLALAVVGACSEPDSRTSTTFPINTGMSACSIGVGLTSALVNPGSRVDLIAAKEDFDAFHYYQHDHPEHKEFSPFIVAKRKAATRFIVDP